MRAGDAERDARRASTRGATSSRARCRAARIPRSTSPRSTLAAGRSLPALLATACSRSSTDRRRSPSILGDERARARRQICASRSSTRPTPAAGPDNITVARSLPRSMLHNLAQLTALSRPHPEPGRARAESALPRLGPRVLLVVHQPAAAAARSTRSSSRTSCRRARAETSSRTRCSCSAASCRGRGSRRRCSSRPAC